jgi:5-methylthioadenosine/S-adenosylhomocysteine deaminase
VSGKAGQILIKGGTVVSMDTAIGELRDADVLVSDGRIVEVGESVEADGAEVVDAGDMFVLPGLVESHRHLFYASFRGALVDSTIPDWRQEFLPRVAGKLEPEDVYWSTLFGAVDALQQGVTTVLDWCSVANTPEHASAGLAAVRESGIRAIFGHGTSIERKLGNVGVSEGWASAKQLRETELNDDDGLVRLALALLGPEQAPWDATEIDVATARELDVPMSVHIGGLQPPSLGVKQLNDHDLLGPDMNFSHCCSTTDEELRMLAAAGSTATASPSAESILGSGTPSSGRMRAAGLTLAIGADSVCCASGDLFQEIRMAIAAERTLRGREIFAEGRGVEHTEELGLSTRAALEAVTIGGAKACWLGDEVGSLTPGKRADVILLRSRDLNLFPASDVVGTIVGCATGSNVDTVLVDGRVVKRDGQLLRVDVERVRDEAEAARDRVFAVTDYPGIKPEVRHLERGVTGG